MIGSKEIDEYYKSAFETCRKEVEETLVVSHNDIVGKTYDRLLQKEYTRKLLLKYMQASERKRLWLDEFLI